MSALPPAGRPASADETKGADSQVVSPPSRDALVPPDLGERPPEEEETHPPSLPEMFHGFVHLSMVSVGGGTSAWARELFVLRWRWMTDDQFLEARGLGQILPGPNMLNFAVYVGSHYHGAPGAVVAFLGLTLIPIVFIMVVGIWYLGSAHVIPSMKAVLTGLSAAAAGASFGTGLSSGKKHFKEPAFVFFTAVVSIGVGIMKWPMIPIALAVTAVAILIYRPRPKEKDS
jgi:chromate transporter